MKKVIIHVDASFSPDNKIASYAFWIRSPNGNVKNSGMLGSVDSPLLAELIAIKKVLQVLSRLPFADTATAVEIHNDCSPALEVIEGKVTKSNEANALGTFIRGVISIIETKTNVKVKFHKATAHVHPTSKSTMVHDWCDKSAREKLQLFLNKH